MTELYLNASLERNILLVTHAYTPMLQMQLHSL